MNDAIKEANLELLIGLKQYLDQAAHLGTLLDRLLTLAKAQPPSTSVRWAGAAPAAKRQEAANV
jgi:hypothetical protein